MIVRVLEGSGTVGVEDESGRSVVGVDGRLGEDMVGVRASDGIVKVGLGGGKGENRVGVDGGAAGVVDLGLMETSLLSASLMDVLSASLMDVLSASLMDVLSASLMDVSSGESTVMTFSALLSIRILSVSNIGDGELELPEFSNNRGEKLSRHWLSK